MIVTEAGKYGIDRNDRCDITKVVFSDLRLSGILAPSELTGVMGNNTIETKATIGLLANGHIIVQAQARPNFTVQSAFIFAQGGNDSKEFLLAIENAKEGSINLDLSIEKIRKLSFNALASDLVLKDDVDEVVASAMAELPHPDFPSLATSVYTEATSYADSATKPLATKSSVDDRLASKADATRLSDYVTKEVLTDVSSGIGTELAKKADASVLSSYVTKDTLQSIEGNVNDHLASKADKTQLDSYYPVSQASESFNSVGNMLNTRARLSDFNALSNAQSSFVDNVKGFTTYASSHLNFLQSKADTDAGNIIYSAKRIDHLESNIDLIGKPAIVNGTSLDAIVETGMYPMDNVDLGSLPANLGLPPVVINGALIVRREFNLVQQTIKDNVGNIYVRNMGRAWSKFKSAEIDNVSRDELSNKVQDNRDGSISFNGVNLSFAKKLNAHDDIFKLPAGIYASEWGFQDSLNNYPSPNGASFVIVYGVKDSINNGRKIVVIDTWGGEYVTQWENTAFKPWEKPVKRSELDLMSKDSFKYKNSYKGNLLDLDKEEDGAYDLYGNMQGTPEGFYGYGLVLKYHNAWNAFLILFDNAQGMWINRQGPSGWNGWRKVATTDMLDALTPSTSTVGKVDPSTVFRGYIEDAEFKLKDLDRPDGFYKVSTWISTKNCTDLPEGFYKDLGYTIQKTTIDDHTGIITVKGIKNMFQLTWLGLGTSWGGWIYSGIMG